MKNKKKVSFYIEKPLQELMKSDSKEYFLSEWYRYMFPYIPFITGTLASTTDILNLNISPDKALQLGLNEINKTKTYIHFKAPYASNQYNGLDFNFTKDLHPKAQAQWAQVAADLHGDIMINNLKNYILKKER